MDLWVLIATGAVMGFLVLRIFSAERQVRATHLHVEHLRAESEKKRAKSLPGRRH